MRNRNCLAVITLAVVFQVAWCSTSRAQATSAPTGGTVVLDTTSAWRVFHVVKSPVVQAEGALKAIPHFDEGAKLSYADTPRRPFRNITAPETVAAPANWKAPNFDDSDWPRGTAVRAIRSPYLERLCLRGKFTVTDPAKVKGLSVSVDYHGGAVVYVNEQEIGRQNLAAGGAMAEAYPLDAFVGPDGKLISVRGDDASVRGRTSANVLKRIQGRVRKLTVAVPPATLHQGLNVVAVELIRAPYNRVVDEQMANIDWNGISKTWDLSWNTCEIKRVQVTATGAEGLVPLAVRSSGFELWNSNPLAIDYDMDQGEAGPLQPIHLVGARNGAYSGKVVLGRDKPIRGLAATAGDLKGEGGTIPASQVQVRYATPWGDVIITSTDCHEMLPYPAVPTPLQALNETAPKEVPVYRGAVNDRCLKVEGAPAPVFGAVVPIWVTVKVPKDAQPGTYAGQVTVSAEGLKATPIAVSLKVLDWTIPDPQQRRTWVELIQSPDTLSLEYKVPLWSTRHWDLIARSMDYIGAVGSHVLYCPLIAQSNAGNDESMVRWIKKSDGAYEYDFSILDKYLDLAEKHMGKPRVLVFNVWDWYMGGQGGRVGMMKDARHASPLVTVLDKATGKTQNVAMLDYFDPSAKARWKPLLKQLKERMQKRGLEKAVMLGLVCDNWPHKEQIEFLKDVSGNLPWANTGHYTRENQFNGLAYGYQSSLFNLQLDFVKSRYGWNVPRLETHFAREPLDTFLNNHWRGLAEVAISGNKRGVGRIGGDTWHVAKDARGDRIARAWERFPASSWGYLNCNSAALAPAPEGAVATVHYEALREGLQECEARVAVEQAFIDPATKAKIGDLAKEYDALMLGRQVALWRSLARLLVGPHYQFDDPWDWGWQVLNGQLWLVQSGWQERGEKLYSFAGQVTRKLQEKEPIVAQAASGLFLAIWIEGENYKTAPEGLEQNVGLKPPASGAKVLYGENMAKKGNVVTYEFDLPADVKDARIIFRYARGDRNVASVELALSGLGGEVKKELAFDETKGWGMLAKEYKLLPVALGDLKQGKHALKLTSLARGSDVSIDGFFVAAKDFKITEEELNQSCRIRIVPEGYVGLARPANAVRQDVEPGLRLAVRSFSGKTEHELAWVLTKAAGAAKGEETILKTSDEYPTVQPRDFPDLEDGAYKIAVSCKYPPCRIEEELFLCGKLLSLLSDRLKAIKGFMEDMADVKNKGNSSLSRALPDLQHIVRYLEDKGKKFGGNDAADESASEKRLAALEGVQAPEALIGDVHRAADQAEKMIVNLKAGKDAYEGMAGDLRRAYRSAADNSLVPYRVFVPDAYAKADKVPFIYMLHGGGGDENSFPDMDGGKILKVLNKRGYLAVCPRWNSRDLLPLLQLTLKEYPKIDRDRVYCTGLSMGGFGTYTLATEHPEFFAAVCCVSGTGDPAKAEKLKNVPLQIFQGAEDPVVAPAGAQRVAAKMKELGYVVDFRIFSKYGHDYHADEYLNLSMDFFGKYTRKK